MDTIPGRTTHSKSEKQISLQISTPTPYSSRSNTTTQEPPDITHTPAGDISPTQFMNSITELRSFSAALSEFLCRYDELHNHFKIIKSSIDSKLPNHIVDVTNPSQSALTNLFETVTGCSKVTVSDQNPKQGLSDFEGSRESERTVDGIGFSQNFEEVDNLKKPGVVDVSNNHEEIDEGTNAVKVNTSKKRKFVDVSKNHEEIDVSKIPVEINTSKKPEVVDDSKNPVEIGAFKKPVEVDVSKNNEEIVVFKKHAETDTSKKPEATVTETSSDQTITAVPDTIVPEQNPNGIGTNFEQIYENVRMPEDLEEIGVLEMSEQTDILNKPEEIDILKKNETDICKNTEEFDVLQNPEEINTSVNHEEINVLKNIEEIDVLKKHAESDTSKKHEEAVLETYSDQTITAVPDTIVPEQNPNGIGTNWEQIYENVQMPKNLEEIDVPEKSEQTDILNKPEEFDMLKKHETDICKNTEEFDVLQNPEEINTSVNHEEIDVLHKSEEFDSSMDWEEINTVMNAEDDHTSKNNEEIDMMKKPEQTVICKKPEDIDVMQKPEEIDTLMNPEEIDTLKKHKETGICEKARKISVSRKHKENETSKKSIVSELETLCQTQRAKEMKWHVASHYSQMKHLHKEIARALKLTENPANLVLNSIGRFFKQGRRTFCKDAGSHQNKENEGRLASVLILECFVMISDGFKIAKEDQEYAAEAAVDWRKRMIKEGGLILTDEVDARGLLFLIIGFRIQDHVIKIRDIADLIIAGNVKGISAALRRSVFLIRKIPEVVNLMVMDNLEIEAADLAFTFGLENKCCPRSILSKYVHKKIKDIQNASSFQMLKEQLSNLKSVKQCLESHSVDPSMLLPDLDKEIQNLDQELNEGKLIRKRKSLENPIHHESKRARSSRSRENMQYQQEPVDHYGMNLYNRSPQPRTRYFDVERNHCNSYISDYSPSPARPAGGYPGSYDQMVHPANVQPNGWHGLYGQRYTRYDQTYDTQPYGRPWERGTPESSTGFRDIPPSSGFLLRRGTSSDLYGFADIVEKESRRFRSSGSNGA